MNLTTIKIQKEWIKDLILLSNECLGKGYLTASYFNKVIINECYEGYCIVDGEKLIAFFVYYKTDHRKIIKNLNDKSLNLVLDKNIICIDTIVVSSEYRKLGIGKSLIYKVIKNNKKNYGFVIHAWKYKEVINMEGVANYFSFSLIKEYPDLWKNDCQNNSFICPVKNEEDLKCNCSCALFYLKQEK
jgi:predicted GNAT family acetyltransferase